MNSLATLDTDIQDALELAQVDLDGIGPVTLPTGEQLTAQQNVAATLSALTDLNNTQIAKLAGYSEGSAVFRFLHSELGAKGVRARLIQHTVRAGKIGLQETIRLATKAKSENVRQMAAAKLLDIARIEAPAEQVVDAGKAEARSVNISINLAGAEPMRDVTIEHEEDGFQQTFATGDGPTGGGGKTRE